MTDSTYLDKILAFHRKRAERDDRTLKDLLRLIPAEQPRELSSRINEESRLSVIAEIKRRSPSKGPLNIDLNPAQLAKSYHEAGAAGVSVLTDSAHFSGSESDLKEVRQVVNLPILRKDFTVDLRDICDARIMGADCVLLIIAALNEDEVREFHELTLDLGMEALVETHDERELEIALNIGARLVGVNQRDLKTFQVDQQRAISLSRKIPDEVVKVAESGIMAIQDAHALAKAGYDAVLVGEALVTTRNPRKFIEGLREL